MRPNLRKRIATRLIAAAGLLLAGAIVSQVIAYALHSYGAVPRGNEHPLPVSNLRIPRFLDGPAGAEPWPTLTDASFEQDAGFGRSVTRFSSHVPPAGTTHVYAHSFGWPMRSLSMYDCAVSYAIFAPSDDPSYTTRFSEVFHDRVGVRGGIAAPAWLPRSSTVAMSPLPISPEWHGLMFNTVFYALLLGSLAMTPRFIRRSLRRRNGRCIVCGYDARQLAACPECGALQTQASLPSTPTPR